MFTLSGVLPWMEMDSISYKSGLLGINVSNLNIPGEGPIDRMIYDCHGAVTEVNANDPRCLIKQSGLL